MGRDHAEEWMKVGMPRQAISSLRRQGEAQNSGSYCPLSLLAGLGGSWWWTCTYPIPFHAHTHFLITICGILIFDAAPQAVSAPPPLRAIALFENFHHFCLVNGVNTLQGKNNNKKAIILWTWFWQGNKEDLPRVWREQRETIWKEAKPAGCDWLVTFS